MGSLFLIERFGYLWWGTNPCTHISARIVWFPLEFKLVKFLCLSNHRAGNFHWEFPLPHWGALSKLHLENQRAWDMLTCRSGGGFQHVRSTHLVGPPKKWTKHCGLRGICCVHPEDWARWFPFWKSGSFFNWLETWKTTKKWMWDWFT